MVDQFDNKYPKAVGMVSFLVWMEFFVPLMLVSLFACWLVLVMMFMGVSHLLDICRHDKVHKINEFINAVVRQKYANLPSFSFAELEVIACFLILLSLWIVRDPNILPEFGALFKKDFYTDATSAMIVSVLLFILPDRRPDFLCWRDKSKVSATRVGTLMDWPTMQHKFPWSVVLLLGGGFALADGVEKSGLSQAIGDMLRSLEGVDKIFLQLIALVVTICVTNICSNTVTAVIFVQIVSEMAENLHHHPLSFMLPTVLACSYAFVLPVATPPNAIVFASGLLTVTDMMKSGLMVTVVSIGLIILHVNTYGLLIFPLNTFPDWAAPIVLNTTTTLSSL